MIKTYKSFCRIIIIVALLSVMLLPYVFSIAIENVSEENAIDNSVIDSSIIDNNVNENTATKNEISTNTASENTIKGDNNVSNEGVNEFNTSTASTNYGSVLTTDEKLLSVATPKIGAYVSSVVMNDIVDGTAPWDLSSTNGNDANSSNRVVRTFDSIYYTLWASLSSISGEGFTEATLGVEVTLDKDITQARFSTDNMLWLEDGWKIEYYNSSNNIVLTQTAKGLVDANGKVATINNIATGSNSENPYRTQIVKQVLYGKYTLESKDNTNVIPRSNTIDDSYRYICK